MKPGGPSGQRTSFSPLFVSTQLQFFDARSPFKSKVNTDEKNETILRVQELLETYAFLTTIVDLIADLLDVVLHSF